MKLSSFIILMLSFQCLFAQSNYDTRVTLDITNESLESLFLQIENATEIKFSYNSELINHDSIITYQCYNRKINKVIKDVFDNHILLKRIGRHIVLIQNEKKVTSFSSKSFPKEIKKMGRVTDARTNMGIENVTIYDIYNRKTILTDADGKFQLEQEQFNRIKSYNIAKNGYWDAIISVDWSKQNSLDILLNPVFKAEEISLLDQKYQEPISIHEKSKFLFGLIPNESLITVENLSGLSEAKTFQVSLLPFVGTNWMTKGVVANNISFNILAGYNGGVDGFEFGGLMNFIDKDVKGLQIAGLSNIVAGNTSGVQVAGLYNRLGGKLNGFQIAGISNESRDSIYGFQLGGLYNYSYKNVNGIQIAGLSNIVVGNSTGLQIAGLYNKLKGKSDGVQIAGLANNSLDSIKGIQIGGLYNHSQLGVTGVQVAGLSNNVKGNVSGVQIAGLFNRLEGGINGAQVAGIGNESQDTINGFQIAGIFNRNNNTSKGGQIAGILNTTSGENNGIQLGLINRAKDNRGLQIGLLNYAENSKGMAIGLFNFVKNGFNTIEISSNEFMYANVKFKSGIKQFYSIYSFGFRPPKKGAFSFGLGFGSQFSLTKNSFFEVDVTSSLTLFYKKNVYNDVNLNNRLDLKVGYKISDHLDLFIGPSYNFLISNISESQIDEFKNEVVPYEGVSTRYKDNILYYQWLGGNVGMRYVF